MTWKKMAVIVMPAVALAIGASGDARAANLVTNGSFESTTSGAGQMGYNTNATDWTTSGYNFIFSSGSADTTGVTSQYGNLQLWGPGNGSANGLSASSPDGGNYVGADGAYDSGAITQTINGLNLGQTYAVSFDWAGAQQFGFDGLNTEQWVVGFGNQSQSTAIYDNTSHGFSGWVSQTFDFTANASSEVLSFLAVGTPISPSVPPFSLLDGVSVSSVPEPSSVLLMGAGAIGFGIVCLRRRVRSATV